MTILNNQFYTCKYFKRIPNESEPTNVPFVFKAQLVSNREKTYNQALQGLFTPNTKLMLRTSSPLFISYPEGEEIRGYVEFLGDIYQIESISYDNNVSTGLGAGRFTKKHMECKALKVVSLV